MSKRNSGLLGLRLPGSATVSPSSGSSQGLHRSSPVTFFCPHVSLLSHSLHLSPSLWRPGQLTCLYSHLSILSVLPCLCERESVGRARMGVPVSLCHFTPPRFLPFSPTPITFLLSLTGLIVAGMGRLRLVPILFWRAG